MSHRINYLIVGSDKSVTEESDLICLKFRIYK